VQTDAQNDAEVQGRNEVRWRLE